MLKKYKATIAPPKGMQMFQEDLRPYFKSELELHRFVDTDDDFFHVTFHVEDSLKAKIQRGEFVDLERLLPQDRNQLNNDRRPVEIVNVGGQTYIGTASQANTGKIMGIRKWEQAFRTYAAIYTEVNPERASEIWQYVYTINLAALSFH